ncbi:MAG: hypothetical protein ACO1OB_34105 [Archangium sp.]
MLATEFTTMTGDALNVSQALSQTTELAISPLLSLTVLSAWKWFQADPAQRSQLAFYAQPWCWGPASALLLLIFFKEAVIARIPGAKKPLDVLQLVENKLSGLIASPLAIGALATALHHSMQGVKVSGLFISTAWAADSTASVATLPDWLTWTFAIAGSTVVYGSVWLASHTINVLILLCPFAIIDNLLKLLRLSLLIGLALLARVAPTVGAIACGFIVVLAVLTAGYSYRWMRFGWSFATGFVRERISPTRESGVFAFSGAGIAIPVRTSGWLKHEVDGVYFHYRRAFVLPRKVIVKATLRIERGLLHPVLLDEFGRVAFRLTPRGRGKEADIANALGGLAVEDMAIARGLQGMRAWLSSLFTDVRVSN